MRFRGRGLLSALLVCAITVVLAPGAAQAAAPGIETFVAINCGVGHQTCAEEKEAPGFFVPKKPSEAEAKAQGYVQAGGHVPYGVTDFKIATVGTPPAQIPLSVVTHVRTDVAPGLATSPAAVPQCSMANYEGAAKEVIPGTGFYFEPECNNDTVLGINQVTVYAGAAGDLPIEGEVYNLVQPQGLASDYGVALELPKPFTEAVLHAAFEEEHFTGPEAEFLEEQQYYAHTLIEGSVEWAKEAKGTGAADYHDYFEINVSPALPLIRSRLVFNGRSGDGSFITNATSCPGHNTTTLKLSDSEGTTPSEYTTPIGLEGCNGVPYAPTFKLTAETTQADATDGLTTEVALPHQVKSTEIDSSQLKTATITLPEGVTMNPSAASGLEACSPEQIGIGTSNNVTCPAGSQIGTVSLEVPTLPAGSLSGPIFLGNTNSPKPIEGPPYTVYLDAESSRYGVKVRLKGTIEPNLTTGRLTAKFEENPEAPFNSVALHMYGGAFAPIANPLACGEGKTETSFTAFSGTLQEPMSSPFTTTGCSSSGTPFALSQSTSDIPATAGAGSTFTLAINRADGNQYPKAISTALPLGLVGRIPAVPLCTEAQSAADACPAVSQIGTVAAAAGAGEFPFPFSGTVYLTGPTEGAPYGLLIAVPIVAGPFNLGVEYEHAKIEVNPYTAQVSVSSPIPTIRGGVLTRLKALAVTIDRQGFMLNPTNCSAQSTTSVLTSTLGATDTVTSGFQPEGCSSLAFKPKFTASTGGKPTKNGGASLETTLSVPAGDANVKSVGVQLPIQLPSRGTTLEKACAAATFNANPKSCSPESVVGTARANTPVLPSKLNGLAYLVGHAGAAFPDLDLVLEANGVRDILVGNTNIKNKITTTTFASTPDVPVTSITVSLPMGPHSALSAFGSLCAKPLVMPTTITGQNGTPFKQNTVIKPVNCGVQIVGRKVIGNVAYITVKTPAAGRVSGSGNSLGTVFRYLSKAENTATIKVPLSRGGQRRRRPFHTTVRIGFRPSNKHTASTAATVTVSFR